MILVTTHVSDALGESPAPGERHGPGDTANTNVIGLAGHTYAIVEAGARPVELTDELATVAHSDLGGTLPHGFSAHPKVDPVTGDRHLIAYCWMVPHLEYVVVGADGQSARSSRSRSRTARWCAAAGPRPRGVPRQLGTDLMTTAAALRRVRSER